MENSYIFLSDSFEQIEALAVVDILRRAGVPIVTISMNPTLAVRSSHGVSVQADALFDDVDFAAANFLILPGGSTRLNDYPQLKEQLKEHSARGGFIAAICAAPMVLGGIGLLEGRRATCFPGFEEYLTGVAFVDEPVVKDGSIITANGAGAALAFGYAILEECCGVDVTEKIKRQMIYVD